MPNFDDYEWADFMINENNRDEEYNKSDYILGYVSEKKPN